MKIQMSAPYQVDPDRIGPIPPIGGSHSRYGVSVKELRDLSLSLSQQAVGKENDLGERFQESSAEYFAGHTVDDLGYRKLHQLEPEYRKRQYQLVEPYISPISSPNGGITSKVEELDAKLAEIEKKAARGDSRETLIEAVKELRNTVAAKWLTSGRLGATGFMIPPPELKELDAILATLENPESTALDVYRAQKRFDKLASTE
jgi:hypothetical protein